jgi:L,D-transpeptidase catalytic domain
MTPTCKRCVLLVEVVKRNILSVCFVILKTGIVCILLLAINGCSTDKENWQDWVVAKSQTEPPMIFPATMTTRTNKLVLAPGYKIGDGAHPGPGFDLAMRNPDFPHTYIEAVYIDLSRPVDGVHLKWAGSLASDGPSGPWRQTPGRGGDCVDCDKVEDSNIIDSRCTPKGTFPVAGFADHLKLNPICLYATWIIYAPRYIAIHSHTDLPDVPASSGCIRMPYATAKLIHNNSVVGVTTVNIYGKWQRPPNAMQWKIRQGGKT